MQVRIFDEPPPKGKQFQRIKIIDALKLACQKRKVVKIPEDDYINDYIKRDWKIHKTCRRCHKKFYVIRGLKREHVQLCQCCTDLRKQNKM